MKLLKWNSISYRYDDESPISFPDGQMQSGELVGLHGPSGSGKTTFIELLSGVLPLQSGTVETQSGVVDLRTERARDVWRSSELGLIPQESHFIEDLTVRQNLSLPFWASRQSIDFDWMESWANVLGVEHLFEKQPRSCSSGERQRLSILRAIALKPSFVLADEPTSALDDYHAQQTVRLFEMLAKELSIGILVITHDHRILSSFSRTYSLNSSTL